ncbi:hypothetical protein G6F46_003567 [Rhizopus delemar]|uniref:Uncharacterized protein n=3 Tax=Rhizopus TaxID=4842 RepID=I1C6M7_RHIO9|nr:hypothetical protein RO3G_08817 [Rhizopus delemar RA 99-880]KAG1453435.1 hypothetical protein G6F55_008144 [Rhizopus delemar]KAG1540701.1 hypothetical protein G6F51_008365 [Rhizopus arrhizus]KAG1493293.1 hypothetical protein G6F54_008684 [Rhizopus delemar]KAG1506726.1 hypothetical protein G6F52_011812 [Rhizopus delemar]|eukprot:EIE84107.1 hypothetical protein RO3G_08817 [Rhizopus delemar RA 99-880]
MVKSVTSDGQTVKEEDVEESCRGIFLLNYALRFLEDTTRVDCSCDRQELLRILNSKLSELDPNMAVRDVKEDASISSRREKRRRLLQTNYVQESLEGAEVVPSSGGSSSTFRSGLAPNLSAAALHASGFPVRGVVEKDYTMNTDN